MRWFDCIVLFLIPTIFILVGYVFWKRSPKEINGTSGWRTEQSMQNQETWNFANTLGAKCTLILGCIESLSTLIFLLITSNFDENEVPVLVIIQAACFTIVYVYVEEKLRKHFNH